MKKAWILLTIVFCVIFLAGCGNSFKTVTIPIDSTSSSEDKATIIIFQSNPRFDFEAKTKYEIIMDKKHVGFVETNQPLKMSIEPGLHELHTKTPTPHIDRIIKQQFVAGQTYYFRLWFEYGMWVVSVWLDPTYKRDSYETIILEK
ncbi:MAG: hypothetical protein J0647_06685 [Campylobacteraceae bacterium]|nr:hypothetical protein [Campylobacteraceae bacterium]